LKKARRKRPASKQSYSAEVIVAPPRYALQESALPASCIAAVDTPQGTDVDCAVVVSTGQEAGTSPTRSSPSSQPVRGLEAVPEAAAEKEGRRPSCTALISSQSTDATRPPSTASTRAGAGARAFGKKKVEVIEPVLSLDLAEDDDSDFEGASVDTRALLEAEITNLCENVYPPREGLENLTEDLAESEGEELVPEQAEALDFFEELELKNELHHKVILHGLTKMETAELFEQHGLCAPKDGDFEIVKQLLSETRSVDHARLKESMRQAGGRVKMRYVNNELVQTKDKYVMPAKDHEAIKATTTQIRLIGNSSKARAEHRLGDGIVKKGPVSNIKVQKKK